MVLTPLVVPQNATDGSSGADARARMPGIESANTPTRRGGLTCQLHFDLLASVKLWTELTTFLASSPIAAI